MKKLNYFMELETIGKNNCLSIKILKIYFFPFNLASFNFWKSSSA